MPTPASATTCAQRRLVRRPAGRADDQADPAAREHRRVRDRPTSGVEKSIATSTPAQRSASGPPPCSGDAGSMTPGDLAVVLPAPARRRAGPSCRARPGGFAWPLSEERLVQPHHRMRHVGVAQHERDVAPRRRPATRAAAGCRSSDVTARPKSVGSARRFSPTAQMIAISGSQLASAKLCRLSRIAVQPAGVVDGHRDADLRGGHHVDRAS